MDPNLTNVRAPRVARNLAALAVVLLAAWPEPARAQAADERAAVRAAVEDYVDGFYQGDTTRLVRSVSPSVQKYGYFRARPDSAFRGMAMPYAAFMRFAAGVRAGRNRPPADAPREIVVFDVQDQTASARLTAWWGNDYLLLARENGRWMITHVLWQSPSARRTLEARRDTDPRTTPTASP